ncbi:MAG: SWIM zinc finger family protein [Chloroflexi bacterium]|nr:SWIM zinc finger family protein [Chloroflexota bacterium]
MAITTMPTDTQATSILDAAALLRAVAQGIKARRLSSTEWETTSSSGQGRYTVLLDADGGARCTCKAGQYARFACKHATLVQVLARVLDDNREQTDDLPF